MVVKLVEVHSHHAVTSNKSYTLREVFINPQRVVSMRGHSIVVVGDPMSVDKKLTEGQRQVLRG